MQPAQEWHVNVERGRLVYQDERGLMDLPAPKLFGRHQFDNAGLAIATLRAQDTVQDRTAPRSRPASSTPNGRRGCSGCPSGALLEQAPQGCEIWLDGGHNAEGGRVAAAALGDLEERVSRPLVVIVGMMANKDASGVPRQFRRPDPPHHRGADPGPRQCDAAGPAGRRRARSSACAWKSPRSVEAALRSLARLAYEVPPRILITGSLYLAGHVLAANGTPPG